MEYGLHNNIQTRPAIAPASHTATQVGVEIDTQFYDSLEWVVTLGDALVGGGFTVSLQEADVPIGPYTAVPTDNIIGPLPVFAVSERDVVKQVGSRGKKRYQRITLTMTGTVTGGVVGAHALLYSPRTSLVGTTPTPIVPVVSAYTSQPTECFDFGANNSDERWFETDNTFAAMLPHANLLGFSVSYWLRPVTATLANGVWGCSPTFTHASAGSNTGVVYTAGSPGLRYAFYVGESDVAAQRSEPTVKVDGSSSPWIHHTCVWDPNASETVKLYSDGVLAATNGTVASISEVFGELLYLGKPSAAVQTGLTYYDGLLAEFALWDGALNQAEITAIYNGGTPPNLADRAQFVPNLVAWYNGVGYDDTGTGNALVDKSGNGNDAVDAGLDGAVVLVADVPDNPA
jgi:hypothetical protein